MPKENPVLKLSLSCPQVKVEKPIGNPFKSQTSSLSCDTKFEPSKTNSGTALQPIPDDEENRSTTFTATTPVEAEPSGMFSSQPIQFYDQQNTLVTSILSRQISEPLQPSTIRRSSASCCQDISASTNYSLNPNKFDKAILSPLNLSAFLKRPKSVPLETDSSSKKPSVQRFQILGDKIEKTQKFVDCFKNKEIINNCNSENWKSELSSSFIFSHLKEEENEYTNRKSPSEININSQPRPDGTSAAAQECDLLPSYEIVASETKNTREKNDECSSLSSSDNDEETNKLKNVITNSYKTQSENENNIIGTSATNVAPRKCSTAIASSNITKDSISTSSANFPKDSDGKPDPGKGTKNKKQSKKSKRIRTSFKVHQLIAMKELFEQEKNPDSGKLTTLSKQIDLPKRVLQVWFQNARAKHRKGQSIFSESIEKLLKTTEGPAFVTASDGGEGVLDGWMSSSAIVVDNECDEETKKTGVKL